MQRIDEKLDFSWNASSFVHRVKALSLTPGGYCYLDEEKIKILDAKVISNEIKGQEGDIIECKKHLLVQSHDGIVEILSLLPSGKKQMDARSFCNGRDLTGRRFH